jgi:trigger factor
LNVTEKESTPTRKVLEIEVPAEEITQELERVVADTARRAALPGFRKGKVPRTLLEQRFGASFEQETLERSLEGACRRAFNEKGIVPLMPAEIEDLKYQHGGPLSFKATVEVRPAVEAKDYKGVPVTRKTKEIADEDVEREIRRSRNRAPSGSTSNARRRTATSWWSITCGSTRRPVAQGQPPPRRRNPVGIGRIAPRVPGGLSGRTGGREPNAESFLPGGLPECGTRRERRAIPRQGPQNQGEENPRSGR